MATSQPTPRVVLDTNVVVAAIRSRNPNSPTLEILRRWALQEFVLLYSDDLFAEYSRKLGERAATSELRERFLARVLRRAERVNVRDEQLRRVTIDRNDDVVVACAVVGKATHLVTYDPHIRVLGPRYKGIAILDSLEFLHALRGEAT